MTEQPTDLDELIAVAETWTPKECAASPVGASRIIESLAVALSRAEGTIEKVREAIRYGSRMDATPTRLPGPTVEDSESWWASWHLRADTAWRSSMLAPLTEYDKQKEADRG